MARPTVVIYARVGVKTKSTIEKVAKEYKCSQNTVVERAIVWYLRDKLAYDIGEKDLP